MLAAPTAAAAAPGTGLPGVAAAGQANPSDRGAAPTPAESGKEIHGDVPAARGSARLYTLVVPDDAVQVDVAVTSPDGEVGLRAVSGEATPARDDDWTWTAGPEGTRAELALTRHAESALNPGALLVEVRSLAAAGRRGARRLVPFTLRVDVTRLQAPRAVAAGAGVDEATSPGAGHRRDFVLDIPAGVTALRIDLVDAGRDLDLAASSLGPPLGTDDAQWEAATTVARESLIIDRGSQPPLAATGRLWFAVLDPSLYDAPVKFRAVVSSGVAPPAEALALPELPRPADPRELALAAAVEIVGGDGSGSGTIVSSDGLVLTASHVVGDRAQADAEVVIGMNLDATSITRDLFRARLVRSDERLDVALLRITSGLYGQPLPPGYRFPACPVAPDGVPRLGDELVTIGFPEAGGTGTRAPVMLSRGVVSGFERERGGLRIKTDAFVASGSSGGAALDARYRLVGVPVFTMSDSDRAALLGFLVPVTELPREWRALIGK